MNQVALFEEWLEIARRLGYEPRFEFFGGTGGGACRVGNKKLLFIDLANSQVEQLDSLIDALANDPLLETLPLSPPVRAQWNERRVA